MACAMTEQEAINNKYEDIQNHLKDFVKCPVCKDRCHNPKILSCSHTFCLLCIERVFHDVNRNCAPCPVCREDFFPPHRDVTNLPNSFYVQEIMDLLEAHEKTNIENFQSCGACQATGSKATHICVTCNKRMCRKCIALHNQFKTESHLVLTLAEIQGTPIMDVINEKGQAQFCKVHPTSLVKYQCTTCDTTICTTCEATEHVSHERRCLSAAAAECKHFLEAEIAKHEPLVSELENKFSALKEHQQEVALSYKEAKKQIKEFAVKCRTDLDRKEKHCDDLVEEMFSTNDKEMQDLVEKAEVELVIRSNLLQHMKSLKNFGSDVQLVQQKRNIVRQVEQIEKQIMIKMPSKSEFSIHFHPLGNHRENGYENFGYVRNVKTPTKTFGLSKGKFIRRRPSPVRREQTANETPALSSQHDRSYSSKNYDHVLSLMYHPIRIRQRPLTTATQTVSLEQKHSGSRKQLSRCTQTKNEYQPYHELLSVVILWVVMVTILLYAVFFN